MIGEIKDIEDYIEGLTKEDHVFVAECNGHVRGIASLEERSGKLRYSGNVPISINEEVQGRGIGKTLLERIVKLADEELGLIRLELDVCADNIRAIALYEMFNEALSSSGRHRLEVISQFVKKVKKQPFCRLVLCLSPISGRPALF
ncbi:GNAT family N-acetyltransferase [Cytobacillus sp. FSL R5-0569]|uniref:GNAT family N-acetyltransferase n=1 Tax=Cytobacillus TaxID=2675230 RepID=UPI0027D8C511|nr:GNAT family N-acetyltransferase [Cytobacillus kochii]